MQVQLLFHHLVASRAEKCMSCLTSCSTQILLDRLKMQNHLVQESRQRHLSFLPLRLLDRLALLKSIWLLDFPYLYRNNQQSLQFDRFLCRLICLQLDKFLISYLIKISLNSMIWLNFQILKLKKLLRPLWKSMILLLMIC